MPLSRKLIGFAAVIALGGLVWVLLPPRSASDCAPADRACLRRVAEHLISESLQTGSNPFITDQIQAAARLLATEGAIDLATQHDRLAGIGFAPRNIRAVFDAYFYALTDPSYPFDIPDAVAAAAGPEGSDLEDYLTAAFRLALRDPDGRAEALALWDQHFDELADIGDASGHTSFFVLSWLARHDPALAAQYFRRSAAARAYISGPGGWRAFFRIAAWQCREGRINEGRLLLDGLRTYFPPQSHIELHLPALLDCEGEDAAVAAIEASFSQWADWAEKTLKDRPESVAFVASSLDDLSTDLRRSFAAWLYLQDRAGDVRAFWSRYGAAEIARRHLTRLDLPIEQLAENQSTPAPDAAQFDYTSETVEGLLTKAASKGELTLTLAYDERSVERTIELEWPSPQSRAAVRGLAQHSKGSPLLTAFVVGLERQLGCAPSDATMQALLGKIAEVRAPLDQARAIIELLRFTPSDTATQPPEGYDCNVH
jgi:hypothetical protein